MRSSRESLLVNRTKKEVNEVSKVSVEPFNAFIHAQPRVLKDNKSRINLECQFIANRLKVNGINSELLPEIMKLMPYGDYNFESNLAYYLYEINQQGKSRLGLIGLVDVRDYQRHKIKKHEEIMDENLYNDFYKFQTNILQTQPIMLAYRHAPKLDLLITNLKNKALHYAAQINVNDQRHTLWRIDENESIHAIKSQLMNISEFYVLDGHHRLANASRSLSPFFNKLPSKNLCSKKINSRLMATLFPYDAIQNYSHDIILCGLNIKQKSFVFELLNKYFHLKELSFPLAVNGDACWALINNHFYGLHLKTNSICLSSAGMKGLTNHQAPHDDLIFDMIITHAILTPLKQQSNCHINYRANYQGILSLIDIQKNDPHATAFGRKELNKEIILNYADLKVCMPPKATCFEPKPLHGAIIYLPDFMRLKNNIDFLK